MIKKSILILFSFLLGINYSNSQTLYVGDNMENPSSWRGVSSMINSMFTGGLSTSIDNPPNYPMYSSSDSCYMIKGNGLGSSTIEVDTFTYPIVPLTSGRRYQIRYKLASFGLNYSVQTAAGVDQTDWIEMQYTVNNGLSWWRDAQVQGVGNSMWSFDGAIGTNNKLNVTRNGSLSTTTPTIYVSNASNPIVNVWVTLTSSNFTTLRIRFITNINASGETFMLDDVEVWDITPILPVELIDFYSESSNDGVLLKWETASEINNDRFELYKSIDGINFELLGVVLGNGNSNRIINYEYFDNELIYSNTYYKLVQFDFDGNLEEYGPIVVYPKKTLKGYRFINIIGQEVDENYGGIKFIIHE